MGKTIIVKQPATTKEEKEKRFCKNCGTLIVKRVMYGGFCCKGCKEEYDIKYHPQPRTDRLDTTSLPYSAYSSNSITQMEKFNAKYRNNKK